MNKDYIIIIDQKGEINLVQIIGIFKKMSARKISILLYYSTCNYCRKFIYVVIFHSITFSQTLDTIRYSTLQNVFIEIQ